MIKDIPDSLNHHILFDSSGGRGIVEQSWSRPIGKNICGYAGGLGVDNIENQLDKIDLAAQFN